MIVLLILIAIVGGPIAAWVTGHPNTQTYQSTMEDEFGLPKGPNSQFWFGADGEGRDLFVRTMYGARTSLIVGVVASLIAVLIGLVVGLTAGFFRGPIDTPVLARRRRDARAAAAPDLDRDRRGVQLEQGGLRRRPDPARAARS